MMRRVFLPVIMLLVIQPALAASTTTGPHFSAELIPESRAPAPGKQCTLALVIKPEQGWHIYWRNPGEAGLPPQPQWQLPAGFSAGALKHPVPSEQIVDGLISNIHENRVALLTDLSVPDAVATGTPVPVGLKVRMAICTMGHCIPHRLSLNLRLVAGNGTLDEQQAGLFREARAALPVPLGKPGTYEFTASTLSLSLPLPVTGDITSVQVFFDGDGVVAHGRQRFTRGGGGLTITMSRKGIPVGASISGVVRIVHPDQDARTAIEGYRFTAKPMESAQAAHG